MISSIPLPVGGTMTLEGLEPARVAIQSGLPLVIIDDCSPSGSSAVTTAACTVTESTVNLLSRISGGILQVALSSERAAGFLLGSQRSRADAAQSTSERSRPHEEWLVSVEARHGVGSGISIADRRTTIRLLGSERPQPEAIARPGHIFPCRCHPGGVLARAAIPEAALDIVKAAGMPDAAVFSYLLDTNGEVRSPAQALEFAHSHQIPAIPLSALISARLRHESLVESIACSDLPNLRGGMMKVHVFRSLVDSSEHLALVHGVVHPQEPTLVRVHVEDPIDDLLGGANSGSSRARLDAALRHLRQAPSGVLVYLRPPLERNALSERLLRTESLNKAAYPTKAANEVHRAMAGTRTVSSMMEFGVGAQILRLLGVQEATILCRTPQHYHGLELFGLRVTRYQVLTAHEQMHDQQEEAPLRELINGDGVYLSATLKS